MERQLFDWDVEAGWDGDIECMQFYKCTLKVPIGGYPAGSKFDTIAIDWSLGKLQLFLDDETTLDFKLNLMVGEQLCSTTEV